VEIGDWVETGAVVGLIEAMKVFNEVLSDESGRVTRVITGNGSLVQAGEALMRLDPHGLPPSTPERMHG
jgi:biotin carboxyl carrier protein